ncbi:basic leucine zipper transcriptional factor ATF-like 2 [Rhinatrema bivittatum]|uniref:basic leucine zipper transcriptional factor ATF-like 2 n=1 Tax=Rhinatrema bivittatum TaxID=194408 RepID=UPI00112C5104|nr:basic leucine zipper transcriptional factor ATF-like 2 [Rhinatrema bivittatum]
MFFLRMDLCARADSSTCSSISLDSQDRLCLWYSSPSTTANKLQRREKNRAAAQRSRQKQMARADELHQEYEQLERENSVLRKEIQTLQQELSRLTQVLRKHEMTCVPRCPNFLHGLAAESTVARGGAGIESN